MDRGGKRRRGDYHKGVGETRPGATPSQKYGPGVSGGRGGAENETRRWVIYTMLVLDLDPDLNLILTEAAKQK